MTHDDIPQPVRDLMATMTADEVAYQLRHEAEYQAAAIGSYSRRFRAAAMYLAAEAVEREAKRKDGQQ